ncbi:antibiotic biosynthesis monooxygenase family protein [Bacillus tuaregi]|uniref:antibiotic biosynthesis monooxygenase family protein n=1 Tax=Bacillus tuaregi TaxID=1816695 RepID=UPI0008F90A6B|nr:antibiotic biosynthesis monooxygenase [Bacillus tuaregi]
MKLYITSGTQAYLNKLITEHPNEELVLMQNEDQYILVHQTLATTIFKEPRRYEVIAALGNIPETGFVIFHYIPVTDEGRPLFEYHFKNQAITLEHEPNLAAIRVLRPLGSDTFLIITVWKQKTAYEDWKPAKAFEEVYSKKDTGKWGRKLPKIFPRPSYMKRYTIATDD